MSEFTDQLREDFPQFANKTLFPDASLEFWEGIGLELLNEARWGTKLNYGLELFVCHNSALAAKDLKVANGGQIPIGSAGVITNKGAGDVSVAYDASKVALEDGGNFNMTVYGRSYLQLARWLGIGGKQI